MVYHFACASRDFKNWKHSVRNSGWKFGGPIGTALGALLGSEVNVFNFGGRKEILDRTVDEWQKIKNKLDSEAACALGLLFSDSITPLGDHQVLAIGYEDKGIGDPMLTVWDNNDGPSARFYKLHFGGDELDIDQFDESGNHINDRAIKGFFLKITNMCNHL